MKTPVHSNPDPTAAHADLPPGHWSPAPEWTGTVYVRPRTYGNRTGPKNMSGKYICDVADAIEINEAYTNENGDVLVMGRNTRTGEQVTVISKKAPPGKIGGFRYYE